MDTLRSFWQQRSLRFWLVVGLAMVMLPVWLLATLGYARLHRDIVQPLVTVTSQQSPALQPLNRIERSFLDVSRLLEGASAEGADGRVEGVVLQRARISRAFDRFGNELGQLHQGIRSENNAVHQRVLAAVERMDAWALTGGLSALLVGALGLWIIHRVLIENFNRVSTGAVRLAQGDQDHRIEVRMPKDVAEVADTLNTLRDSLVSQQQELAATSVSDRLTGLNNRRYFEQALRQELLRAQRFADQFCLILLEIDHFKGVNDSYGHQQGDEVLKLVGGHLQATVRQVDAVCRYSGAKFVVIMPHCGPDQCRDSAGRLRRVIAELPIPLADGTAIAVTCTFGGVVYPDHAATGDGLIRRADNALYEARRHGHNRVLMVGDVVAEGPSVQ
ncbi:GGDEF domain-containing protein [Marinobacter sp. SS21]|uniref:GGDEF domain-containing protein n=1 Tax=Marinobacter sp. SS21 TaxID=2979460 RepID=UPI0023300290|nr:diguanylate cyclase [Marinobacter sp. SS21]MDC0661492.1 diguanylate cyclase [Marinobacter sp. SS21]